MAVGPAPAATDRWHLAHRADATQCSQPTLHATAAGSRRCLPQQGAGFATEMGRSTRNLLLRQARHLRTPTQNHASRRWPLEQRAGLDLLTMDDVFNQLLTQDSVEVLQRMGFDSSAIVALPE